MQIKKIFAFVLIFITLLGTNIPLPAVALGDDYSIRLIGREDRTVLHNGRNTYTVEFQVRTAPGAVVTSMWMCRIAFDTSVFELVSLDGNRALSDTNFVFCDDMRPGRRNYEPISDDGFMRVYPVDWTPELWAARSLDESVAFLQMTGSNPSVWDGNEFPEYTTLGTIRLAFREDRDLSDVYRPTLRLMSQEEMNSLEVRESAQLFVTAHDFTMHGVGGSGRDWTDLLTPPLIDFEGSVRAESVIVPSISHPDEFYINLTDETIELQGELVVAFSTNAGRRWRRGDLPTDDRFSRLFNNGVHLHLAIRPDSSGNATAYVTFPAISRRPRITRGSNFGDHWRWANVNARLRDPDHIWVPEPVAPWYGEETWNLTKRGSGSPAENDYIFTKSWNRRAPDAGEPWRLARGGRTEIPIEPVRGVWYLFRTPPTGDGSVESPFVPASRIFAIRPRAFTAAPNRRIRNNAITMRNGDVFTVGDGEAQRHEGTPLDVTDIPSGTSITIWRAARGTHPPSLRQEIIVP